MMTLHLPVLGSRKEMKGFGFSGRRLGVGMSRDYRRINIKVRHMKTIWCDEPGDVW